MYTVKGMNIKSENQFVKINKDTENKLFLLFKSFKDIYQVRGHCLCQISVRTNPLFWSKVFMMKNITIRIAHISCKTVLLFYRKRDLITVE